MFQLPRELIDYIYSFDDTNKKNYDKTVRELNKILTKEVVNCYPIKINNFENSPLFVNTLHYTSWLQQYNDTGNLISLDLYYINNAKNIYYNKFTIHLEEYLLISNSWIPNITDIINS